MLRLHNHDMGKMVYRMMIGMYPARFRQEHGRDMLDLYDDLRVDCAGKQVELWRLLITDWCAAIIDQYIQNGVLRMKSSMMMKGMAMILFLIGSLGLLYGVLGMGLTGYFAWFGGNNVVIYWDTDSEIDNRGFNIRRSTLPTVVPIDASCTVASTARVINSTLIPSKGEAGGDYVYDDYDIEKGVAYCYQIESVDTTGATTSIGETILETPSAIKWLALTMAFVLAVSCGLLYAGMRLWRNGNELPTGKVLSY